MANVWTLVRLRRQRQGAISFFYHHINVYTCADPGIFSGLTGGVRSRMTGKGSDVLFCICFVSPQFILLRESISKKLSFNYDFPIFHGGGRWGPTFPRGWGPIAYSYPYLSNLRFYRGWEPDPLPPLLEPRLATLTGFLHTSSWPQDIAWHSLHWRKFCWLCDKVTLFNDWRYLGVLNNATTRVVYRVSKALCVMGLMEKCLVLFPTSDAKGVSTILLSHIKYRITHMLCPTLYAVITNELNC